MEELWKDIGPSPIYHPGDPSSAAAVGQESVMFQDFLGPPPPTAMLGHQAGSFLSSSSPTLINNPQPGTVLSLNSGVEFHFLEVSSPLRSSSGSSHLQSGLTNVSSASFDCCPFEALASSPPPPALSYFAPKKRGNYLVPDSGDRRYKRMIKNRESAARSRARKQAYTSELELEITQLREENAKLKQQQEKIAMHGQWKEEYT
ncbi:hypothetical protein SAY86_014439 [Trapa natans]|uniref:BZIP domain-containing protein n=1 Tax=Trapa natans TaxID=22666 RepID=A0AAN7KWG7_TRANT|nr:hypothetical protein SAY86_014439 [Trapa natans]